MKTPRTEKCRQAYIDQPLESGHDLLIWKLAETLELELIALQRRESILVDAMSEIKATSDGKSDQPIADIVTGCIAELSSANA